MYDTQDPEIEGLRLYDLLKRFKEGDNDSYCYILKRFSRLIEKESFNVYLGMSDEDLRAQIYLALFIRLKNYTIPEVTYTAAVGIITE